MYFTEEDLKKIERYIVAHGAKDSSFALVDEVLDSDTVAILHNGENKRISISTLISGGSGFSGTEFINATKRYGVSNCSITEAVEEIPLKNRSIGAVVTYEISPNNWGIFQYKGRTTEASSWILSENWENILRAEQMPIDNNTIVVNNSHLLEVGDNSIDKDKLGQDVKTELSSLQEQIIALFLKHVQLQLTSNVNRIYKGYSVNGNLSLSFNDEGEVLNEDISSISIKDGTSVIHASSVHSHTVTLAERIDSAMSFVGNIEFSFKGSTISLLSNTINISEVYPIYYGIVPDDFLDSHLDSLINESHLFSKNNPVSSMKNQTASFNMTNNQRTCLITTENNLSALDGGFNHPLNKTTKTISGITYYVYTSENTYSSGVHSLTYK